MRPLVSSSSTSYRTFGRLSGHQFGQGDVGSGKNIFGRPKSQDRRGSRRWRLNDRRWRRCSMRCAQGHGAQSSPGQLRTLYTNEERCEMLKDKRMLTVDPLCRCWGSLGRHNYKSPNWVRWRRRKSLMCAYWLRNQVKAVACETGWCCIWVSSRRCELLSL
jgi:hypothetical protein